ncbi:hypothetical protein FE633_43425 [Streptomyces montanus]|uniref:Uncharacterized protein n=1 Tax=Streptomyces montanus TaxID=2580423 RepID=A0A5R9F8V2_9ACTN|nr:hypothetical protein [Streptomyces montanus]TLS40107.1 hypothetical protein FE633_43425 [Streptomyces montanus]
MTATYAETSRRRRILVSAPAESVNQGLQESPEPQEPQEPQARRQPPDPPIYRALIRTWSDRGRTLPGRHDPEWVRLVAPSIMYGYGYGYGRFSASRDPRGDGR